MAHSGFRFGLAIRRQMPGKTLGALSVGLLAAGCATLPASGPRYGAIASSEQESVEGAKIKIVDVTAEMARLALDSLETERFATQLGDGAIAGAIVGSGDVLDISIWEAPPALLFGSWAATSQTPSSPGVRAVSDSRSPGLPEQTVGSAGTITIPFVGAVQAAGRTTEAIAQDIRSRLTGKAHDPQVLVRVARNTTANVTVVGEVTNSVRMPLTAKGERLLDALASAGGVRQPFDKMTVQVTRGDRVGVMPLAAVAKDPQQNIRLQAGDVVTLLFQPFSFTVLGAASKNEEIPFEGTGLTLSQALGRMGGLQDQRASPRGVFLFRFEDPRAFSGSGGTLPTTKEGKVPVIYRVDMREPATLFVAQSFPIKDKDVIYITNAPIADFQKFLQAVSQIVYPIAVIQTTNIF